MKYIRQFGIILLLSFFGEILHYVIPFPIPASIYGILLLFIGLKTSIIPLAMVHETGKFLIEIMPIMFIPAAVGLLNSWQIIAPSFAQYITITILSTVVVIVISGRITQRVIRSQKGGTVHE
ncbi:antiholin-like protein LrgA [Lachnospiraceae bacterium KM106-2]|nr:antiholin-like protein LrgA [Lachnospiraceae bacterium KM106-2]